MSAAENFDGRAEMLDRPHMRDWLPVLADLRCRYGEVPSPDPLDGGTSARLLILLETPGPTVLGSGFVSLDNASGTSRNLGRFLGEAGISRHDVLIWNAVPWVIDARNRVPRAAEIREGLGHLPRVLNLLQRLAVVVLSGRVAAAAAPLVAEQRPDLPVIRMPHPSPAIQCTSPDIPARCRAALTEAAAHLAHATRSAA